MRFLRHDLHDYDMLNCLNMKIFIKTDGYEITDIFEIAIINGAVFYSYCRSMIMKTLSSLK